MIITDGVSTQVVTPYEIALIILTILVLVSLCIYQEVNNERFHVCKYRLFFPSDNYNYNFIYRCRGTIVNDGRGILMNDKTLELLAYWYYEMTSTELSEVERYRKYYYKYNAAIEVIKNMTEEDYATIHNSVVDCATRLYNK